MRKHDYRREHIVDFKREVESRRCYGIAICLTARGVSDAANASVTATEIFNMGQFPRSDTILASYMIIC